MKLKHLLLGTVAIFCSSISVAQEAKEEQWYVIGSFCDWSFDKAAEMTRVSSTKYTVTLDKLEGEFKFAMPGWENDYGYDIDVTGNCSFYLESKGANLSATTPLENVTISINFRRVLGRETADVTFSGLPTDMEVPDKPTKLSSGSPVFYNLSMKSPNGPIGHDMTNEEDGTYTYTSSFKTGEKFVIADAVFRYPAKMDSTERWTYLRDFEYGPAEVSENPGLINLGETKKLKYPAEKDAIWEIQESGVYIVVIDPVNLNLSLEKPVWNDLYICGNVRDPYTGVENGFLTPNEANRKIYDDNFKLIKRNIGGKEFYQGRYQLVPKVEGTPTTIDDYAQFRFFRALMGWTPAASLGSAEADFYCQGVTLTDGKASCNIIESGLGNWGFPVDWSTPEEDLYLDITVDLEEMIVYFGPYNFSGIEKIETEKDTPEVWYNTQGMRVNNPGKGLYIRMTGNKCEKVIR
ncbi:MAG: hypothetical protein K2J70_00940 [Muribaculaceae bacterium]|nr:hypothetical protein [Muribaculaceae bacterium]